MRKKSREAIDAYLKNVLSGCRVETRRTPGKGRGLYATAPAKGEPPLLFADSPLGGIVHQSARVHRGLACELCGHALGSPEHQLKIILDARGGNSSSVTPAGSAGVLSEAVSDIVPGKPLFPAGALLPKRSPIKTPLFCSCACLEEHERLFGPLRQRPKALRRFLRHARAKDCPFYVLALKLICWVIAEYRRTGDSEAAAAPLRVLASRPYWDAVDMPAVCSEKEAARLQRGLRKDVERSRILALAALEAAMPVPPGWPFLKPGPDGYPALIGALCCNVISVLYPLPVVQHAIQLEAMLPCEEKHAAIRELEPWLLALQAATPAAGAADADTESEDDAHEGGAAEGGTSKRPPRGDVKVMSLQSTNTPNEELEFSTDLLPNFRGFAIFPRTTLINHSCQPNSAIEFTFSGSLFLLAQKGRGVSGRRAVDIVFGCFIERYT